MQKKLFNVNYGLASSYDNFIEINKKLKGSLRKKILAHEKRHDSGAYSLKDWKNDFQSKDSYFLESLWFSLKNPEALINFFLIMYSYHAKTWTWNSTVILPFLWFGAIWTLFWSLLFKISLFQTFLGYVIIYAFTNIILIIFTHWYVCKQARS